MPPRFCSTTLANSLTKRIIEDSFAVPHEDLAAISSSAFGDARDAIHFAVGTVNMPGDEG